MKEVMNNTIEYYEKILSESTALFPESCIDKDKDYIIWGISHYAHATKQILEGLEKSPLRYWDRRPHIAIDGVEVVYPELETASKEFKENTVIIMAFTLEKNIEEVSQVLERNGFKHFFSGKKFVHVVNARKIVNDYNAFITMEGGDIHQIKSFWIFDNEWHDIAGTSASGSYFQQDLWAARKIFKASPAIHYDIGSRVDGFITHLLSFETDVVLLDIRPYDTCGTENLSFIQTDATYLKEINSDSIESLSALCSLEHFGLGRYGDPVDPKSVFKAFKNIQRVMKKGGDLYVSLELSSTDHVVFNAHRCFHPKTVTNHFNEMELVEFSCTSRTGIRKNMDIDNFESDGCYGLFHFKKK